MNPTDFNLRHLRALAATVRLGSLSAAAREIGVTQPAVTQAIGRLETLAGTKLLDRSGGAAVATAAGILLGARGDAAAAALASSLRAQRRGADIEVTMAQVTALRALADHGSYAAAGTALGLAQPSLHRAVSDLERLSGLVLAERRGRGVALTEAGERLAAACRLALAELQAAIDELAVLAGRDQGRIRIAADRIAMTRLLPPAIARFLGEHPPVVIEIEEMDSGTAAEALRSGRIDALLMLDDPALRMDGIAAEPIAGDGLVAVGRKGHPLAGAAPGPVRLAQAAWALPPPGSAERSAWDTMFLDGGLYPPAPSVTLPSPAALLDLVARSDLLTIASQAAVHAGERLTRIGEPLEPARRLVLAVRDGWAPTPAQATFLEEVRTAAAGGVLAF